MGGKGSLMRRKGLAFVSLLVLVSSVAIGCSARREREATLKGDLRIMRDAIDNYTLGMKQAPQSLQDLVDRHYLKEIPADPFTEKKDWVPQFDGVVLSVDQTVTGIVDVHSNSARVASNGTPYNEW